MRLRRPENKPFTRMAIDEIRSTHLLLKFMIKQRTLDHFQESARLKTEAASVLADPITAAVELMFTALSNGNKILACGNGGSAADSQHFAAELVGRFERERLPLPAMALTTDTSIMTAVGNDYSFKEIFSKQVQAFGQNGDVLLAFSTSGNSENVLAAIEVALERDMRVVALTGKGGGKIGKSLTEADVHICVPHDRTARIQEVHLLAIHCICDGIDVALFGEDGND
jgi:D-sedoheptulose 7-phosphate isomerase